MVDVLSIVLENAFRQNENVFRKWRFVVISPDMILHDIGNAECAFKGKHDDQWRR